MTRVPLSVNVRHLTLSCLYLEGCRLKDSVPVDEMHRLLIVLVKSFQGRHIGVDGGSIDTVSDLFIITIKKHDHDWRLS